MINAKPNFEFKGSAGGWLGVGIIAFIISAITFGLAFPWAYVMVLNYEVENIAFQGRRLKFNGTGFGLLGNWIKWWFLTIITLGIYSFWVYPNLQKWKWSKTDFE